MFGPCHGNENSETIPTRPLTVGASSIIPMYPWIKTLQKIGKSILKGPMLLGVVRIGFESVADSNLLLANVINLHRLRGH